MKNGSSSGMREAESIQAEKTIEYPGIKK